LELRATSKFLQLDMHTCLQNFEKTNTGYLPCSQLDLTLELAIF